MDETVTVSGLPLHLMGWNTTFQKIEENQYRLASYNLFGLIPIIGVTLSIDSFDGKWKLKREIDNEYLELVFDKIGDNKFVYHQELM